MIKNINKFYIPANDFLGIIIFYGIAFFLFILDKTIALAYLLAVIIGTFWVMDYNYKRSLKNAS